MDKEDKDQIIGKNDIQLNDLEEKSRSSSKVNYKIISFILMGIAGALAVTMIVLLCVGDFKKSSPKEEDEGKWEPQGDFIKTTWGENLDPKNVLQEYPRPQMKREQWINLNGLWDYSIAPKGSLIPRIFDGKILVPFPVESSLSGVMKKVTENDEIWYQRTFEIPKEWDTSKQILLNFGAVDWKCDVFINYQLAGQHEGGYAPFSVDITYLVKLEEKNKVTVRVYDPSDHGYQPVGKQALDGEGIWYTPSSGIWQTVWLEPITANPIQRLDFKNSYDAKKIILNAVSETPLALNLDIEVYYQGKLVGSKQTERINTDIDFDLSEDDFHPWSPEEPNLYDLKLTLYGVTGDISDVVSSYTAIRKISKERDEKGIFRIKLNNEIYFSMGTLDQGFWPDGLYTAPSEEAIVNDIQQMKNMGFNTIRKHVKVEPARFYYNCDKMGLLVYQDMPSGNNWGGSHDPHSIGGGTDANRTQESKDNYYKEWGEIIDFCKFFQSIVMFIPFNEAWGQFETLEVTSFTKKRDPSRLTNPASGGNYRLSEEMDVMDFHHYPWPYHELPQHDYVNIEGEYGSLGFVYEDHVWSNETTSSIICNTTDEFLDLYRNYTDRLKIMKENGDAAAAIFTQHHDVETEINGLLTYDRKVVKFNVETIKQMNEELIHYPSKV